MIKKTSIKIPVDEIIECCNIIEDADYEAAACDGPIQPTASHMTPAKIQKCLSTIWACREAALTLKKLKEN